MSAEAGPLDDPALDSPALDNIAPASTRTGFGAWLVLVTVLPGMFMNVFDFFAVNVATPVLHRNLGSGAPALELIVGGYGLTFSLGLVTGGRLGDRYGRRRVFFAGMAAFTVASAASGLAPTSDVLVVARLFQGAATALGARCFHQFIAHVTVWHTGKAPARRPVIRVTVTWPG